MSYELLGQVANNIIWKEKEKDESDYFKASGDILRS